MSFPVIVRGAHVVGSFPRCWHRCNDLSMQQSMIRIWALRLIALLCATLICAPSANALELTPQLLDQVQAQFSPETRSRFERWQQLLNSPSSLPENRKLLLVNSFFNQVKYMNDIDHWKVDDYWATPFELLTSGAGDCEDYSIAKYFTLRQMGVPEEKLRITYVKALKLNQAHMVLAYYPTPDAEPLILDNLANQILPASQRQDLYPVYSFNGDGLWLSKQRGAGKRVGDSSKLNQWSLMNERFLKQLNGE